MDIVIVGPCGSGKTTLKGALNALGYGARAVAQEHSIIRNLWRHGGEPAAVIYLDATPEVISARRAHDFPAWLYAEQQYRLAPAHAHASLIVDTTTLTAQEVYERVVAFLKGRGIQPEGKPDLSTRPGIG